MQCSLECIRRVYEDYLDFLHVKKLEFLRPIEHGAWSSDNDLFRQFSPAWLHVPSHGVSDLKDICGNKNIFILAWLGHEVLRMLRCDHNPSNRPSLTEWSPQTCNYNLLVTKHV